MQRRELGEEMTDCFAKLDWRDNRARDIMSVQKRFLWGLVGAASLAGCVGNSDRYPSLALREFETRTDPAPLQQPEETQPPIAEAASAAQIAAIKTAAETAFGQFTRLQPNVATMVRQARGQSVESNARARALVALADLNGQRSATYVHLGDLDQLAAAGTTQYQRTEKIDAARREVTAMIAQQDQVLTALWAEMGQ